MKKILIVIHDMRIGGAQKSLLSFLQSLSGTDTEEYAIDLMVYDPAGPFYSQIPGNVRLVPPPRPLRWLGASFDKALLKDCFSLGGLWGELCWLIRKKTGRFPKGLNLQQRLWYSWQGKIPRQKTHYDTAISYMDGVPNYYVMDKVSADKKFLWVHSEYQKQGYDREFDRSYYENAHGIITISSNCKACILKEFPEISGKIHILENISSSETVLRKSREGMPEEYASDAAVRLLTVARLNPQKGIDLAIDAAAILKNKGLRFLWLVAGDGQEREALQAQIEKKDVADCFRLLGSRENPYVYMKHCHILVQPSRVEGKSIVLDEAKILCKPIVATNYTTVGDSLKHGETGWIVNMDPKSLAEGILELWQKEALRRKLEDHLSAHKEEEELLLQRYVNLMFA